MSKPTYSRRPAECIIPGCGRTVRARGWCNAHYKSWRTHGDPLAAQRREPQVGECAVDGCSRKKKSRGLCPGHYQAFNDHGDPLRYGGPVKPSLLCSVDGCVQEAWSKGFCDFHYSSLRYHGDPTVIRRRNAEPWTSKNGYIYIQRDGSSIAEHRAVMEQMLGRPLREGENVHHINGVRDDNRPENLELWTRPQPAGARVSDLLEWAHKLIEMYEGEYVGPKYRSDGDQYRLIP